MTTDDVKHHPTWVKRFNAAIYRAQDRAAKDRCKKKKSIMTYLGSFVEQPMDYQCLLDMNHDGLCEFDFRKVESTHAPTERKFSVLQVRAREIIDSDRFSKTMRQALRAVINKGVWQSSVTLPPNRKNAMDNRIRKALVRLKLARFEKPNMPQQYATELGVQVDLWMGDDV